MIREELSMLNEQVGRREMEQLVDGMENAYNDNSIGGFNRREATEFFKELSKNSAFVKLVKNYPKYDTYDRGLSQVGLLVAITAVFNDEGAVAQLIDNGIDNGKDFKSIVNTIKDISHLAPGQ